MKFRVIPAVPALLLALVAAPAMADSDTASGPARYASVSSLNWNLEDGFAEASGVRLVLGQQLSDNLSVELHGGMGGDDNVTLMTTDPTPVAVNGDLGLQQLVGLFLRAQWPVTEQVRLFGLVGYSRVKAEFEGAAGFTAGGTALARDGFGESESGNSYGGGLEFNVLSGLLDGGLHLTADYIVYLDRSGARFDARSVGLKLAF